MPRHSRAIVPAGFEVTSWTTRYPFDALHEADRIDPEDVIAGDPHFPAEIHANYRELLRVGE